jgi:hypothetical protein
MVYEYFIEERSVQVIVKRTQNISYLPRISSRECPGTSKATIPLAKLCLNSINDAKETEGTYGLLQRFPLSSISSSNRTHLINV